ncbi:hypothetical protein ACGF5F_26110 [Streptomyces sp. NPDC047821]|uniref:hypothetical protein n=1 Tax=Streptomyces sp. NPDC047821 TaxID=3365488 RepID=UPI00371635ED
MGFTSAWAITAHTDDVMAGLRARVLPLTERHRRLPEVRRAWLAWCADPLPDHRDWDELWGVPEKGQAISSFLRLTSETPLDDLHCSHDPHCSQDGSAGCSDDTGVHLYDLWETSVEDVRPYLGIYRKDYAVSALFHAIGPERAALLPGWCGNFALTAEEVRRSLPAVERALGLTPLERVAAEERIWLDAGPDDEPVLDGPLRCWREAAEAGLGLLGAHVHLY